MAIYTYPGNTKQQLSKPVANGEQLGIAPAELQHTLKLAGLLQTSLEIDSILKFFLEAAEEKVDFDGVQYEYPPLSLSQPYGNKRRHTCSYRLRLAGEFLGELEFSRRHRFAQQEMELLENLLCHLIYPLRNAIWYQQAIMAAQLDPLTGIQNRAALDKTLAREVTLAHRNNTPLSLIVVDIDFFKKINDEHGHATGDDILKSFAQCINNSLRGSDIVFRYGGEEFVILLTGSDGRSVRAVANRVRKAIEDFKFISNDQLIPITASLGTASLTNKDSTKSLFKKADQALYCAKESGRNQVVSFQSLIKSAE
ncbi:MAG: GGDEF domain-containing protein [Gammaproteobacteria bacterium]|nr:GGDEF domain-containing protein [Gammaproteobacteria bacterium]